MQIHAPRLAEWLFSRLWTLTTRREPDFVVGDPERPYLLRWWLIPRNRWLNFYLHQFLRSDDDRALHDHPWWSLAMALRGRYVEHTIAAGGVEHRRVVHAGTLRLRSARLAHRLEILPGELAWTLFITGPLLREWGFHCKHGWVPWHLFVSSRHPGQVSSGCDASSIPPRSWLQVWKGRVE